MNIIVVWAHASDGAQRRYSPTISGLFAKKHTYNGPYINKPFKADKSLTVLGKKIAESLIEINGVEAIEFRPQEFIVRLRDGFKWEEVHPAVIKTLTFALGWDEYELLDSSKWLEQTGKENEMFSRQLRGDEPDNPEKYVSPENIHVTTSTNELGLVIFTFMAPKAISEDSLTFSVPVSLEMLEEIERLDDQRKSLVSRIFSVDGVIEITLLKVYLIEVITSPAFDGVKIREQILSIIKEVYLS